MMDEGRDVGEGGMRKKGTPLPLMKVMLMSYREVILQYTYSTYILIYYYYYMSKCGKEHRLPSSCSSSTCPEMSSP